MGTVELKLDLHRILENMNNEQLLRTIHEFLKAREHSTEGTIWSTLTEEQKKEVYLSYEESEEGKNLTSWEDVKKKY